MAILIKVIRDSDGGLKYLRNMCNYIWDGREQECGYGGYGLNPYDAGAAYSQMEQVKRYYGQTSTNPLVHFVVSFDGATDNAAYASQAAPLIAGYFKDNYQVMWGVHPSDPDSSHHHMHILLNSVNLMNGTLFHSGPYEVNGFCNHVKTITGMPYRVVYDSKKKDDEKE